MSICPKTVIKVAKKEIGYIEKSKSAYKMDPSVLDKKKEGAGSDNYTKYGRDMHKIYPSVMDFPAYWCDCFVDWCFQKAYGISTAKKLICGNFDDYTISSSNMYKSKNAWHKNPKAGDQVFFKNSKGRICHTGLVVKVRSNEFDTIEGNTSYKIGVIANGGCVALKTYPINYVMIAGFGRPPYDSKNVKKEKTKKGSSVIVKVNASRLAFRNSKGKKIGSILKGCSVSVLDKNAKKMIICGTLYTMSKVKYKGKTGYVAKKYLKF